MRKLLLAAALASASLIASLSPAAAYERWMRIHNQTDTGTITNIYASHVDRRSWGRDLLSGVLSPGYQVTIYPGYSEGYCMLDLQIVFDDRDTVYDTLDFCTMEDYTITGN